MSYMYVQDGGHDVIWGKSLKLCHFKLYSAEILINYLFVISYVEWRTDFRLDVTFKMAAMM